jgi:hypothetical protein
VKEMRDPTTTRADEGPETEQTYRDSNGVLHVKKRKGEGKGISIGEAKTLDAKNVKAEVKHDCATHVKHAKFGEGRCVPEMHTIVEISEGVGYVSHYDVMFEHGIEQNVPVESLMILASEEHGHMPKKSMKEALVGNQDKIDANHNGKIDGQDFKLLRNKNKFMKFSKKKMDEEKLAALYNSLSEENQVKFETMFETEEGIEQLIRFAEAQGIE